MSVINSKQALRTNNSGIVGWLQSKAMAAAPFGFRMLRSFKPIPKFGSTYIVTRYDDVIEVFARDDSFDTPYKENIDVLTGGEPFFLGMRDTKTYRDDLAAMRTVMQQDDLTWLGDQAEIKAQRIVTSSGGKLEVVGDLVRKVTFELYCEYLGIPEPGSNNIDVWSTRLFEFQFTGSPKDVELRAQVDEIVPVYRKHVDEEIARRKRSKTKKDDVLGRCLALQKSKNGQFTDVFIRTYLLCMMVGGPPQVPMVTPHALEQLLRRPDALNRASKAARLNSDDQLWRIIREAMRFDPLAPALPRLATKDVIIAQGTKRATAIPKDATVLVAFSSAMMDTQRLNLPSKFNEDRGYFEYVHFGHGLHQCFGRYMNEATIPRILKPLLQRKNLRRANGKAGHLSKNGIFSEKLVVTHD